MHAYNFTTRTLLLIMLSALAGLLSPTQTKMPAPKCAVIDGKETAAAIRKELKVELDQMKSTAASPDFVVPGLAVILVGARPDSATYVRMKSKACEEIGYKSIQKDLAANVSEVRVHGAAASIAATAPCHARGARAAWPPCRLAHDPGGAHLTFFAHVRFLPACRMKCSSWWLS